MSAEQAWLDWLANPSLATGNRVVAALREQLGVTGPETVEPHDVAFFRSTSNQEVAEALRGTREFAPAACHWALNVAAHRLAPDPPDRPPVLSDNSRIIVELDASGDVTFWFDGKPMPWSSTEFIPGELKSLMRDIEDQLAELDELWERDET
jgi:hypothetical protein